ncbi:hypothetical protein ACLB2K_027292 [Fragaria x ananassa]
MTSHGKAQQRNHASWIIEFACEKDFAWCQKMDFAWCQEMNIAIWLHVDRVSMEARRDDFVYVEDFTRKQKEEFACRRRLDEANSA